MTESPVIIETVVFAAPETQLVISLAEQELDERYGANTDCHPFDPSTFETPHGAFLVARRGAEVAGGVGVRYLQPGYGEIKRLWVVPIFRRSGLGMALMTAIEKAASTLGIHTLVLETGPLQPEAIALYGNEGWELVDELPIKVSDYEEAVCFVKTLQSSQS